MIAACPDRETLESYLLGQTDDLDFDAHLAECRDCQAALDALDADVNRPFDCLRLPIADTDEWQAPTFQQLVADAKALPASSKNGHATLTGTTLGSYLLAERVGAGGMGHVYKAMHQHLKKTVAVKVIAPDLLRSPESRQRFKCEMQAVGGLASPHIVAAFDAGEVAGHDFLVMEYVAGKNLAEVVRQEGPLPIEQALDYTLQAARGLAHAHAAGIIHRDVKPSNLLLDASGTVKVLDLGLARLRLEEADDPASGVIMGTVPFMAPEQALATHQADERSDIYSLGCTLYFLVTGKLPYDGKNAMATLAGHREKPIPSLRAARPECSPALDELFHRLVAKKPGDRPASMSVVIAELERLAGRKPARRSLGHGFMMACGLVAACLLAAVGLWSMGGVPGDKKDDAKKDGPAQIGEPKKGATPVIEMVRIAPGKFWMGASDSDLQALKSEKPRREIAITRAFLLGKFEVTQAQYEEVMGTNPAAFSKKGQHRARVKDLDTSKHPVESVSWLDAVRFCNRLSERHGLEPYYQIKEEVVTIKGGVGYRLPTEAEWEYACRGGTTTSWHFGEKADDLKEHAWIAANSGDRTHPVGEKKANPWGLHDMLGNVPEWCWDRYDEDYYHRMPTSDPPGAGTGRSRVFRGDAFNSLMPRTAARQGLGLTYGSAGSINLIGFRVARNAGE